MEVGPFSIRERRVKFLGSSNWSNRLRKQINQAAASDSGTFCQQRDYVQRWIVAVGSLTCRRHRTLSLSFSSSASANGFVFELLI